MNVAPRVLTRKNAPPPPPWWPRFSTNDIIRTKVHTKFHQDRTYIIGTNLLTKFHDNPPINVDSRPNKEKCPTPAEIYNGTNFLHKFHEDMTINVGSRVLTRFYFHQIGKKCPAPGGHVFRPTATIFEIVPDIIETNLLTKFHEDRTNLLSKFHKGRTINVTSRVFTTFYYSHTCTRKCPLPGL
ncbi:hypothetical protein DPMN_089179 [Dreissena polymorpha]|uniref:Uncharacterized protein n=1 Tax=Dreissena polymorpha TaxID=45954 RepID=A0A9D4QXZ1_DREPO|nr:hypothetical protein DPMN_089179 [Dreissena polymorpha]